MNWMRRECFTPEQAVAKRREPDVLASWRATPIESCRVKICRDSPRFTPMWRAFSSQRGFWRDFLAKPAVVIPRYLVVLACLPFLMGYNVLQATPANADEATADAGNAQSILDENDRIIAENKRIIVALQEYSRIDSAKLERLTAQCQAQLGTDYANGGAKRIYDCIHASW